MTTRIAYGFQRDLPGFADLNPAQAGARLRSLGFDAVFMHGADAAWIDGLHAAGLRVYESLGVFAGEDAWAQFPDSRPIMADGKPAPREAWYAPALPTLPALRAHRLRALDDLLQAAPVDGLWLDFIRWPARWERAEPSLYDSSFDPVTLRQFQDDTGVQFPAGVAAPTDAAAWLLEHAAGAWFQWRCEQIVSFVAEARALVRRHHPGALLGVFVVPWTDADFADAHGGAIVRIVGQDLTLLAPFVDVFSPMVYHRLCRRAPTWVGQVTAWARARSGGRVWPIIETLEPGDAYPLDEFAAACRSAAEAASDALLVFKLDGMLLDPARLDVWKTL